MTATAKTTCPCGSGAVLDACCGPLVAGKAAAPTAEALLRSRYTAFTLGKVDYLIETNHSRTRAEVSPEGVKSWCERAEWLGLEIHETAGGGASDERGEIRFVARYREKGVVVNHLEVAQFERETGAWRFVTGSHPPAKREAPKVGRNDPCTCGSGKKWKKCCGAKG